MNQIKYKDYIGSVDFEDGVLRIQIMHIDDFVTTECNLASEVQGCFEELVDDYLETCKQLGKDPCKSYKGSLNIRMAPDLHRKSAIYASSMGVTLNSFIEESIRSKINSFEMRATYIHALKSKTAHNTIIDSENSWISSENYDFEGTIDESRSISSTKTFAIRH